MVQYGKVDKATIAKLEILLVFEAQMFFYDKYFAIYHDKLCKLKLFTTFCLLMENFNLTI